MFALRGLAITLSAFAVMYAVLSLVTCVTWRRMRLLAQHEPIRRVAVFLLALRLAPLAAALLLTVVLAAPSFVLLEPRGIREPIGVFPLVFGICGLVILIFGFISTVLAVGKASRTISEWMSEARRFAIPASLPILRISRATPAMTAVGIFRPKILFSEAARLKLEPGEFRSALNHEIAHVRSRDNLKKLLLQFVAIPGLRGLRELEEAWLEATEMAADYSAVCNASEALDLAAALVKLCRLGLPQSPSQLSMVSFSHSSIEVVNKRIERLMHWAEQPRSAGGHSRWYGAGLCLCLVAVLGISYSHLLVGIHLATEWLVR